jgi:hypothetical protein
MKTMTILRSTLGLAAIACATLGVGVTAEASSTSAFAGQPQNPADYTCFDNTNGMVTNVCTSTVEYCVPLLSSQSAHTVEITLYAPTGSEQLQCMATSVTQYGVVSAWSGWNWAPQTGGDTQLVLSPTNVPSEGGLYACCSMEPGSRIDTIQF